MKKFAAAIILVVVVCGAAFSQAFDTSRIKKCGDGNLQLLANSTTEIAIGDTKRTYTDESFSEILFDLIVTLLFYQNLSVYYDQYPCADGDWFIRYGSPSEKAGRVSRYTVEVNGYSYPREEVLAGNEFRFEGMFYHIIGPVIESSYTTDSTRHLGRGNLRIGGQYSLFQTNCLCTSFFLQWSHFWGDITVNGANWGFILKSYLPKPFLVEWRVSWAKYGDGNRKEGDAHLNSDYVFNSHLEIGYMMDRFEIFAAWKRTRDGIYQVEADGICAGLKIHF